MPESDLASARSGGNRLVTTPLLIHGDLEPLHQILSPLTHALLGVSPASKPGHRVP